MGTILSLSIALLLNGIFLAAAAVAFPAKVP